MPRRLDLIHQPECAVHHSTLHRHPGDVIGEIGMTDFEMDRIKYKVCLQAGNGTVCRHIHWNGQTSVRQGLRWSETYYCCIGQYFWCDFRLLLRFTGQNGINHCDHIADIERAGSIHIGSEKAETIRWRQVTQDILNHFDDIDYIDRTIPLT